MAKLLYTAAGAGLLAFVMLGPAAYAMCVFGRPPMPVPLGAVLRGYETGFTVTKVIRRPASSGLTAYDVTARVFCPYGERYHWTLRSAHVFDNDGRTYYASSGTPAHRVLGASDTEHMTFLLPTDAEQPALVFDETLGFWSVIEALRAGPPELYEPHRFNLRYD
ncbi:MAG TPA: hypothetical protein VFO29_08295 [Candidatus Rubrimentiphilum sp.]|nr:hypothetical protein [Candidatus Rubrimentiphilum sp.]